MKIFKQEFGISMVEILAALSLLSFASLGILHSSITSHNTVHRAVRHTVANQLAFEKMEELASLDPQVLDNSYNTSEVVVRNKAEYSRVVSVVVEADRVRTVRVLVKAVNYDRGGRAEISSSFALRGKR